MSLEGQSAHVAAGDPALVGYHPSGVAPVLQALFEADVDATDVFVDLGSGLGKVVFLAKVLTGADVFGVERDASLASDAARAARRLDLDAPTVHADARDADLDEGTVFFLYSPFTGSVLAAVLERLHAVARDHAIVVCALGVDLDHAPWLARRPLEAFWLAVYDSKIEGVTPRRSRRVVVSPEARMIMEERPLRSR